eukprot:CAMPEP_0206228978 /NCGR_PEP_ID=MMETSP0047_2-20121206/9450_1 /ASSEMBLY_ACC=CAM_ASM_000192 /TAXON_ID=195065 /ORGANISM="Chroomonas mesostigmatica_cf, Strain CCMP1168" /LENGTH=709 /DNA_ID=CAMNT_0053652243 /DNA_START=52 /DNA_END=2181 /DNA_ORIENTATION=+
MSTAAEDEIYMTPLTTPLCVLESQEAFQGLSDAERRYAHHLGVGSWGASLACLVQTSPESPALFSLLFSLFQAEKPSTLQAKASAAGVSDEDWVAFMQFCACFFGNMGNYLSFGDTKFVPRCEKEAFGKIVGSSVKGSELVGRWQAIADSVYDLSLGVRQLGLEGDGISTYYSAGIKKSDIELVQEFLADQRIGDQAYNTRLFKKGDVLQLCIASAEAKLSATHAFKGAKIVVQYGDHAPFMKVLADNIEKASADCPADRPEQLKMCQLYVKHFNGGNINDHKDSQRAWIMDKAPPVETNIGFIESYRDPFGVRGEFEGFVAVVNREQSRKFQALVDHATEFIAMLPWPPAFEKDEFLRPDFTSLDVIAFASSGIPAGINIPNYDDIRQDQGFKNVSLGNVLSAASPSEKITFLTAEDELLFQEWRGKSFEVQVAIHELLGHGSGKLLREHEGALNFDKATVVHPVTGKGIETYYKPGETWDSKFGAMSSSYEECRAECVGIYLCSVPEILTLFGHDAPAGGAVHDVIYGNWLIMVRAGLLALEYYSPASKTWRQAHMQARYVILRVLLEAGQGLVALNGKGADTVVSLDRGKILSVGRSAIGDFLLKLNVYKATADVEAGQGMYGKYSEVPQEMLELRETVLECKQPRKLFVQPVTRLAGGAVELQDFPATPEGMIASFVARFADDGPLGGLVACLDKSGQFPYGEPA